MVRLGSAGLTVVQLIRLLGSRYCGDVLPAGEDIAEEGTTATRTTLHSSFFFSGVVIFTFLPSTS